MVTGPLPSEAEAMQRCIDALAEKTSRAYADAAARVATASQAATAVQLLLSRDRLKPADVQAILTALQLICRLHLSLEANHVGADVGRLCDEAMGLCADANLLNMGTDGGLH